MVYNTLHMCVYVSMCGCPAGIDASRALQLLTQSGPYSLPSLENVVSRATSNLVHRPEEAPLTEDLLNSILLVRPLWLVVLIC